MRWSTDVDGPTLVHMAQNRRDNWPRVVGRAVKRYRLKAGLTQEAMASSSEIDPKHLQKIEAGTINVTIETLGRIATTLKVHPRQLLGE